MRYLATLLAILVWAVAAPASSGAREGFDSVTEYLLTSAASDFRTHGPAGTSRFRGVRRARLTLNTGEEQHMLCGEFFVAAKEGNGAWAPFSTVKTSGYEQWLGAQSGSFCQNSKAVFDKDRDLTAALQSRFDALK